MNENYVRYGKYLKLDYISESFYAKSYKSKFFGTDNFYKIFSFDEISKLVTEDPIIFDKFMRIIKANSKLNHSNIIKIIDFHDFQDTYALVSEYFSHEPLIALMASYFKRKKQIPVVVAVFIISQVCDAVGYAQSQEILHGNINPLNILITHEGLIKVREFSFYNNLSISTNVKALNFKQFRYIAPEKFKSNMIVAQSDVYSLAVILYEMLTGKTIYSSKDVDDLIKKITEGEFTPINKLNPEVPKELAEIVEKALSLNPEDRFENPIKFKYAIQRYLIQGHKIFSAQHFYVLMGKLFSTSISKEVQENTSYKSLNLSDFQNALKPSVEAIDDDFTPELDDDLFEGDNDKTSILFDNIEDIDSVDEIESLKDNNTPPKKELDSPPDFLANENIYDDDDEKTNILDEDEASSMYEEDEKTNILNDEDDLEDAVEEEVPAKNTPKQSRRKDKNKDKDREKEELVKLLNDESNFNIKSFIIGLIVGLVIGVAFTFLK
jgi:serine/threonine-protein kinase